MPDCRRSFFAFAALLLFAAPFARGAGSANNIENQLKNLRSAGEDQRPAATVQIAKDIQALPAGARKVDLADALSHLVTEGDAGQNALQAVADTLAQALKESPVAAKHDKVPMPYFDLARLAHYEHVTASLDDLQYAKAMQTLADDDASLAKADFTLRDMRGKNVTLSQLRGKIVMVNFWATWCAPCRTEMPVLDMLSRYFEPQGLVVLSITDENMFKVGQFFGPQNYHPTVLFDPGGKVHQQFHVTGIPNTFLFGRDGKLLSVAVDQRTRRQFLKMLSLTDLHP